MKGLNLHKDYKLDDGTGILIEITRLQATLILYRSTGY